ncbi:hypothetical protein PV376_26205 [Streptomyces sp. NRRL_ISP-5395]|uniref:hypothetical protein n=1 Tax=Streptomyces TaxID=1883 RepID=UPI00187395B2|nr:MULTISPECIES: hypothetical protein [Streptomyces]MDX2672993.1 hypothetical protein [Streptomyces sp. NRRL_ISP-5395]QXQ95224.1 hypothetical protein KV381_02055 [Streptomyces sp. WY228]GHF78823.1 hypothetical protein GCM10010504_54500 [Streptomyces griseus]
MTLRRESFLDRVRERGEYGTRTEAERAARVVADAAGGDPTRRIPLQLPPDYDVFFGGRARDT